MTSEEAKQKIDEMIHVMITIYEQKLFGEELQPYVVSMQKKGGAVKDFLDEIETKKRSKIE
jgi:hypothetical protein